MNTTVPSKRRSLFNSKRGRILRENITAYLFLSPALLLIFLFGIFPVGFAFYVSLHRWRRFPDEYIGFDNYERALGSFSYILFFWLALGAFIFALIQIRRMWMNKATSKLSFLYFIPAVFNTMAIVAVIHWLFTLLPVILDIPQRIRGQETTRELFMSELIGSFSYPEVLELANTMLLLVAIALAVSFIALALLRKKVSFIELNRATFVIICFVTAYLLFDLTYNALNLSIIAAQEAGEELPVWSQIIFISLGVVLLFVAYRVWTMAHREWSNYQLFARLAVAFLLMFAGFLLIVHVPPALATADKSMVQGFNVTVMYSLGTVPLQLAIGMGLAYLLFQNIRGKALFRIIYFLPYIMPFVATSIVFRILFSNRTESPINQFIGNFGIEPQKWLLEPTGIFHLMFPDLPDFLAGPGLALVVIMIYGTWTYIGYDAVVFLAGLGNISSDIYEAARIDGASRWHEFRYITFPLLSPTTFFLSLIAIIGTFQAFTQIWIMRTPAATRAVDTVGVYIFTTVSTNSRLGYGSAMAFVLFFVILALTLVQNRVMGRRVFYG